MKRQWRDDELAEQWTILPEENALLWHRKPANRLGFAVQLKFFPLEIHFPTDLADIPVSALDFVASQDYRLPQRDELRRVISAAYRADETACIDRLLRAAMLSSERQQRISDRAQALVTAVRAMPKKGGVEAFMCSPRSSRPRLTSGPSTESRNKASG
jgi:hypothetical protein